MNAHLTNGAQSIPKLIQTSENNEVKNWGPRPIGAAALVHDYKEQNGVFDAAGRENLQQWYNSDKGRQIIDELLQLLGRK
jgi:hypothetical protein